MAYASLGTASSCRLGSAVPPSMPCRRRSPPRGDLRVSSEESSSPPAPAPAAQGTVRSPEERLAAVPARPGVYLLKDGHGKVIYVGKAANLRNRVRTYLRGGDERSQVRFLVERLADFETLVTANDKEALILENNLIKQYRPRYNIRLKDDKSYVSVKVTVADPWPRVLVTRRIVKDGGRYFGPFASASAVRETLDTIRKVFPLRTCSDPVFRNRSRPCIEYDIKRCLAPCVLAVDRSVYEEHLREAMLLLEGRNSEVARELRRRMEAAAAEERFEVAARLRDQLQAIETTQERQQVVEHWGANQDVFGLYREGGAIEVQVLFVRSGKLVPNRSYSFDDWEFPDEEVLEAVLTQFYQAANHDVPDEILLPVAIGDADVRARGGLPDLLVIDGGLGQLGAARPVFAELGLTDLEVVGLAKERVERDATASEIRRRPERIFLPGRKNPVVLKPNSSALFLLQRVRDEAHRFVNLYHRKLRARARLRSRLDAIAGIGPRRRRALLRRFGSLRRIGEASAEELAAVPGITLTLAAQIKEELART